MRRIRDTTQPDSQGNVQVIQEQHFDKKGFLTIEISFNNGFPDVIAGWGWLGDKRVNNQSAVNYPIGEGPGNSRSVVISGYVSSPSFVANANPIFPPYGNRFDMTFDPSNRPLEKSRYASNGSLVLVEHYKYLGNFREIRTTDSANGFISSTRERLDSHNNILETQVLSADGSIVESTEFAYKFDEKGNWIEKRAFKKLTMGRRPVKKSDGVFYRNIQYYESKDQRQVT